MVSNDVDAKMVEFVVMALFASQNQASLAKSIAPSLPRTGVSSPVISYTAKHVPQSSKSSCGRFSTAASCPYAMVVSCVLAFFSNAAGDRGRDIGQQGGTANAHASSNFWPQEPVGVKGSDGQGFASWRTYAVSRGEDGGGFSHLTNRQSLFSAPDDGIQ